MERTPSNVVPLRTGHLTPAESAFDRDLRATRDRLAAEYDRRPFDSFANDSECMEDLAPGQAIMSAIVFWFADHQRHIGLACYVIAVLTAMYFAFQLGRGVL